MTLAMTAGLAAACAATAESESAAPTDSPNLRILTGLADINGSGSGSVAAEGWTYGVPSDVMWQDAAGTWHDGGPVECLPPYASQVRIRFAAVDVTIQGTSWRPIVWIQCPG
jgi:hypothetical protein